jgi:hypothetical protein
MIGAPDNFVILSEAKDLLFPPRRRNRRHREQFSQVLNKARRMK